MAEVEKGKCEVLELDKLYEGRHVNAFGGDFRNAHLRPALARAKINGGLVIIDVINLRSLSHDFFTEAVSFLVTKDRLTKEFLQEKIRFVNYSEYGLSSLMYYIRMAS